MKDLFELIESVAASDANILIQGENGTGKELIANAIHHNSNRVRGPFIKINCAAIPNELIESELFGYRKGAFTGATADKVGLFEMAEGGSLLLDEIGEMPPYLQTKLLRVLQEREYRPIGSDRLDPGGLPPDLRHQHRPRERAARGAAARGPVLPHQHHHAARCRRCGSAPRTFRCCAIISWRSSTSATGAACARSRRRRTTC